MKKVFAFTAFALIFAACSNVAKFKPMIEELAAKWDSTTTSITDLANMMKSEQANWMNAVNGMQVAPEAMAKWDDAAKAKYNEIQTAAQTSTTNFSGIASDLDAFVSSWGEKSKEVQALKDGLAAGKLEGDVQAKIAELTAAATDATTKVSDWQAKFNEIKTAAANAQQMFASFMETTQGATAGKK